MLALVFDISGKGCSAGLFDGDGKVWEKSERTMDFGQAEALIPAIAGLLEAAGAAFSALGAVIVCAGPGSFAGVRAGIAAAKAFGLANPALKVIGVSALEAYVFGLSAPAAVNAALIDTKRGDFYYQFFDKDLKPISEPAADTREAIMDKLEALGKDFKLFGDFDGDRLSIESLAQCGLEKIRHGEVEPVAPLYIRPPYACL